MSDMIQIPREALKKVEWCCGDHVDNPDSCPLCSSQENDGHKADCPIGIALKPKEVVPKTPTESVQHEMTFNEEKYVTECTDGTASESCRLCDFLGSCCNDDAPSDSVWCYPRRNADGKNRFWKKVTE